MTDEEIRKLATQFTEEIFKDDDMSDLKNIDDRHDIWEVCNSFGMFLLERHCIVPKVEILNQHAWYMQRMKEVSSNRQMNRGKAIALETLFGKSLFEEDKE